MTIADWFMLIVYSIPLITGVIGGLIGWRLRGRAARLGMPWALLPAGAWLKKVWNEEK